MQNSTASTSTAKPSVSGSKIPGPAAATKRLTIPNETLDTFPSGRHPEITALVNRVPLIPSTSEVTWLPHPQAPPTALAYWDQDDKFVTLLAEVKWNGRITSELCIKPQPSSPTDTSKADKAPLTHQTSASAFPWVSSGLGGGSWASKVQTCFGPGSKVPQDGSVDWEVGSYKGPSPEISERWIRAKWTKKQEAQTRSLYEKDGDGEYILVDNGRRCK